MARLYPDANKTRVIFASRAEEQFYRVCRESLGGSWEVYYSVNLSSADRENGLRDGEMDFVLYHPRYGIIVVEVKGGLISFDSRTRSFRSVNLRGQSFAIKNPFQQSLVWRSRLVRFLKDHNVRAPVTHCVCFPQIEAASLPKVAHFDANIVIGKEHFSNFEKRLRDIVNFAQTEKFLNFDDIRQPLNKLLIGANFHSRLFIKDYISSLELQLKDVEVLQEHYLTPLTHAKKMAIEGEAGTGKTMLAFSLAKHYHSRGSKVLFLSSSELLNRKLKIQLGKTVEVQTYNEFANQFGINVFRADPDFRGSLEDWLQYEAPERIVRAIDESRKRFDVVICDEAQDVQPFWWDAIEGLLRGEQGRLYVFFDRSQGVFGSGSKENGFVPEDVLPIAPPYFPLVNNYRTTREIASFCRSFRVGKQILASHSTRFGYLPRVISYKDPADAQKKLAELTRELVDVEGLQPKQIALLSGRRHQAEVSVLKDVKEIGGRRIYDFGMEDEVLGGIKFSTIPRFKGLETDVGIMLNLSEYNLPIDHPIMASMIYVAASRAKHMLYIFAKEGDAKEKAFKQVLDQLKVTGALIIDEQISNYELEGEVVHYNPQRVGWLSVNDQRFSKANVMFFPSDIGRASIEDIKIGDRLFFRPRIEGFVTIATDFRKAVGEN